MVCPAEGGPCLLLSFFHFGMKFVGCLLEVFGWNCLHSNVLALAVSCFGSGPWLRNGAEVVSASLYKQQSNRTQETPPWS